MTAITLTTEGLCSVCRKIEHGIGVRAGHGVRWLCDDPDCLDIAIRSTAMKQDDFNRLEAEAAIVGGGNAMGAFLDELGVFQLDKLAPEQWAELCKRGAAGYRKHLKKLVDENAAPF